MHRHKQLLHFNQASVEYILLCVTNKTKNTQIAATSFYIQKLTRSALLQERNSQVTALMHRGGRRMLNSLTFRLPGFI